MATAESTGSSESGLALIRLRVPRNASTEPADVAIGMRTTFGVGAVLIAVALGVALLGRRRAT